MWRAASVWVIAIACVWPSLAAAEASGPAVAIPTATKYTLAKPGLWTHELVIFAGDDKEVPLGDVLVIARPAVDADGSHEIKVSVDPVNSATNSPRFHRRAPARVTVRATFEAAGTYATAIYVSAGGAPATAELSIEVKPETKPAATALPLAQVGSAAVEAAPGETATVGVWLSNTSDAKQTLTIADITGRFARKAGTRTLSATGEAGKHSGQAATDVAPRSFARVFVDVTKLDGPGEYTGDLAIAPGDGKPPIAATATIYVRRGAHVALLVIAFGIALTWLITWLRDRFQPRSEVLIAIRRLEDEITALATANETIAAAQEQLRAQAAQLRAKIDAGIDDALRKRVERLGQAVALVQQASTSLAAIAELTSPATQRAKRKIVDDAIAIALDPTAAIDTGSAKLRELGIDDARRGELWDALDALVRSVDEHRQITDAALQSAIDDHVAPPLHRALDARSVGDLVSLEDELSRARSALATAGLRSILAALDRQPSWVEADAWNVLTARVHETIPIDPAQLAARYEDIRDRYVDEMKRILLDIAAQRQQQPPSEELAAAVTAVKSAADRRARLEAMRVLQELLFPSNRGTDRLSLSRRGGAAADVEYPVGVHLLPRLPEGMRASLGVVTAAGDAVSWQTIQRRLRWARTSTTLVVAALALLGGLKLLWIDNATWGSPGDLLAAFLWGTGAKLTADAFGGLTWLRGMLGKAG